MNTKLLAVKAAAARESETTQRCALGVTLTEEQKIILEGDGKKLINGGPGGGKSTVLAANLAKMICEGADPTTCLVLSFSRRTCAHLSKKIAQVLDERSAGQVKVWTLHKLAMTIVDEFWEKLGRPSKPTLINDRRLAHVMRQAYKRASSKAPSDSSQRLVHLNEETVFTEVGRCKANLVTALEYGAKAKTAFEHMVALTYTEFEAILLEENGLDFGGYVMSAAQLLEQDEEVKGLVQEMHSNVLVDEGQDVDLAMFSLLALIVEPQKSAVFAIDPDQAIYGFRSGLGVTAQKLFLDCFPETAVFALRANARNPGNIVQQANWSRRDPAREQQALRPAGAPIYFCQAASEHDEQIQLGDMIERALMTGRYRPSDIAVLCRSAALIEAVEAEMLKRRVAYTVVGRDGFFDCREIRQILAYAHLALDDDLYYLMDVINTPARGLDKKVLDLIRGEEPEISLKQLRDIDGVRAKAGDPAANGVASLWDCIKRLRESATLIPEEVIDLVLGTACLYNSALSKDAAENQKQMTRIRQLYALASGYHDLRTFIQAVDEMNGEDAFVETQDEVQVMTMHSAKGLEFPIVFILGMENGVIPHHRTLESEHELSAERRLLVMAMTRAKDYLIFLRCRERCGRPVDASLFAREFVRSLFETRQPDFCYGIESKQMGVGDG